MFWSFAFYILLIFFSITVAFNVILLSGASMVVRHLYNSQRDAPGKSRTHLAPHTVVTILLTTFPVLCCSLRASDCCVSARVIPSPFSPSSPKALMSR